MFEVFTGPDTWIALPTLTCLQIVLDIDNILFISIAAVKLAKGKKATYTGLVPAL